MVWNLAIKFLFLCLSGGMRLIKINHTHFVIAKTIAINFFLGITDNKINPQKTSLTKGEANLAKNKIILS